MIRQNIFHTDEYVDIVTVKAFDRSIEFDSMIYKWGSVLDFALVDA